MEKWGPALQEAALAVSHEVGFEAEAQLAQGNDKPVI
jgi:hypothetical protein